MTFQQGHLCGPDIFTWILFPNPETQLPVRQASDACGNSSETIQVSEGNVNLPPGFSMHFVGSLGNGTRFRTSSLDLGANWPKEGHIYFLFAGSSIIVS